MIKIMLSIPIYHNNYKCITLPFLEIKIIIMKEGLLVVMIALTGISIIAQQTEPGRQLTKQEYLDKSKRQKTTGWVLIAGGTAMAVIGGIIFEQSEFLSEDDPDTDLGGILFATGLAADLASIPFFISSGKNARKAATISFKNQKILLPLQNGFVKKNRPAITLIVHL